jgi:membrane-associated phospholipid phosphatase
MKAPLRHGARAKPTGPLATAAKFVAVLGHNIQRNIGRWCRAVVRPPRARPPRLSARAIAAIVVMLAAVVASMFLIDAPATHWARHLPNWFTDLFEQITNGGESGWLLIPCASLVLIFAALTSPALSPATQGVLGSLAARIGFLFIAIGAPGLFTTIVKRLIGRARPYMEIHGDPFTYVPFAWRPEYASLPSGHATTAVATAFAIGALWPRTRWVMCFYALVIMFSRVVVQSHHPSDAIAGALVGAVGAALVRRWFASRRLVFSARDLSVYPGPSWRRIKATIGQAVCEIWRDSRHP